MGSIEITALYAAILAIIQVVFTLRVGMYRQANKISIGDGGHDELNKRIRGHGNFVETVPIFLILMALAEINGLGATWMYSLASIFVIARLSHYFGLAMSAPLMFRFLGMLGTMIPTLIMAVLLLI